MEGESKQQDYKLKFDPKDSRAKVDLVKNIVAFANSGGGKIIFGRDETKKAGIDSDTANELDSARLDDFVSKYIKPANVTLSHEVLESLQGDMVIFAINIEPADYPIVMSRQGSWTGKETKDRDLFNKGDIWTRHSSKTERVNYNDVRKWIETSRENERNTLLDRIQLVTNLPEGYDVRAVSSSGTSIETPSGFLENESIKRGLYKSYIIEAHYLLWLFQFRDVLRPNNQELSLLIASGLRRGPTLHWWLLLADDIPSLIVNELEAVLESEDRDKSDAARNVIDLAAIYANDTQLKTIVEALAKSRYSHFKSAAKSWSGRQNQINIIITRINNSKFEGKQMKSYGFVEIQGFADGIAKELLEEKSSHKSRVLAGLTRMLWFKRSTQIAKITQRK